MPTLKQALQDMLDNMSESSASMPITGVTIRATLPDGRVLRITGTPRRPEPVPPPLDLAAMSFDEVIAAYKEGRLAV
jgi:hypothetical protein